MIVKLLRGRLKINILVFCLRSSRVLQAPLFRRLINIVAVMALVMVGFTAAGTHAHGAWHSAGHESVAAVQTPPCHSVPAPVRSGCKDLCATHAPDQMADAGTVTARTTEISKAVTVAAVPQYRAPAFLPLHTLVRWRAPPGEATPPYLRHLRLLI